MKTIKSLLLLSFLLMPFWSIAQPAELPNLNGFQDFALGTDKQQFGDRIQYLDSIEWEGITDYNYVHHFTTSYEIAGIQFHDVLLTFNKSNKLKEIQLTRVYTEQLYPNHKIKFYQDHQKLYSYLNDLISRNGKMKNKFNSLNTFGYEWNDGKTRLWSYLQSSTTQENPIVKKAYFINLTWNYCKPIN